MCLVAFQKIFRKIFSSVWKRRKENTNPDTSHNPENTNPENPIARRRDRDRRRDLAKRRPRSREREIAPSRDRDVDRDRVFWVVACVWICVFLSSFPNTRKYFPKIFLKCNQTHENIFLSGNGFTRTKHNLIENIEVIC